VKGGRVRNRRRPRGRDMAVGRPFRPPPGGRREAQTDMSRDRRRLGISPPCRGRARARPARLPTIVRHPSR
jgi:hypothetical protein